MTPAAARAHATGAAPAGTVTDTAARPLPGAAAAS